MSLRQVYQRLSTRLGPAPLSVLVVLVLLTAMAWGLTLYQSLSMHADMPTDMDMDMGMTAEPAPGTVSAMATAGLSAAGWSFPALAVFVAVWTVMMAAMMLPAAAPMILIFASAQARRDRHIAIPTWIFVAGYLVVWAGSGVLVYLIVQVGGQLAPEVSALDRHSWTPVALGATLAVAGVYQFTPLKHVCLRHCRSPFGFVAQYWRDGRLGALQMGARHGLYCLGCCWALFAVLVAAGIMSLAWMLLLTVIVFAEKVLPYGQRTSAVVGVGFFALGLLIASGTVPVFAA
jgi:predicted metal-binding membrane protein